MPHANVRSVWTADHDAKVGREQRIGILLARVARRKAHLHRAAIERHQQPRHIAGRGTRIGRKLHGARRADVHGSAIRQRDLSCPIARGDRPAARDVRAAVPRLQRALHSSAAPGIDMSREQLPRVEWLNVGACPACRWWLRWFRASAAAAGCRRCLGGAVWRRHVGSLGALACDRQKCHSDHAAGSASIRARRTLAEEARSASLVAARIGLHFQEVADHLVAALGEHALGMELHALDRQGTMAQAHDDGSPEPSALRRAGRYVKFGGQRLLLPR